MVTREVTTYCDTGRNASQCKILRGEGLTRGGVEAAAAADSHRAAYQREGKDNQGGGWYGSQDRHGDNDRNSDVSAKSSRVGNQAHSGESTTYRQVASRSTQLAAISPPLGFNPLPPPSKKDTKQKKMRAQPKQRVCHDSCNCRSTTSYVNSSVGRCGPSAVLRDTLLKSELYTGRVAHLESTRCWRTMRRPPNRTPRLTYMRRV